MTRQEIYNKVRAHLLAQNEKSLKEGTTSVCLYRGPRGLKYAIGCLIKDEAFNELVNSSGLSVPLVKKMLNQSGIETDEPMLTFLLNLQSIHDCDDPKFWSARLDSFAVENELHYEE